MQTILIVEDDDTLRESLESALKHEKFQTLTAKNALQAREKISGHFNLILMDLNLPDGDGFSLCAEIKQDFAMPVIFLTVRDDERDIVRGLDMGGDDYITKPFRLPVLLSRIRAVLRRAGTTSGDVLRCGRIELIQSETRVLTDGYEIPLTSIEYRLLLTLMEHKNQTLTRNKLLERLWDDGGSFVNDNTLTVTIKRLREKLGEAASIIKTVRGIGYKAVDGDDE